MKKQGVLLILFLFVFSRNAFGTGEEEMGRAAEQKGNFRDALTHYVAALQTTPEGSSDDQRLREKIILVASKLDPVPAVPEEAKRFLVRGETIFKEAKSDADYLEAAAEFREALRLAPWWSAAYYNLGLAQEGAGQFDRAIQSLKFYVLVSPAATDAEQVKNKIWSLETKQERAGKAQAEEEERRVEEERKLAEAKALLGQIAGRWYERCTVLPSVSETWEFQVTGDQQKANRWNRALGRWDEWNVNYDPQAGAFTVTGWDFPVRIVSGDYMVVEFPSGEKCEWKRQ